MGAWPTPAGWPQLILVEAGRVTEASLEQPWKVLALMVVILVKQVHGVISIGIMIVQRTQIEKLTLSYSVH